MPRHGEEGRVVALGVPVHGVEARGVGPAVVHRGRGDLLQLVLREAAQEVQLGILSSGASLSPFRASRGRGLEQLHEARGPSDPSQSCLGHMMGRRTRIILERGSRDSPPAPGARRRPAGESAGGAAPRTGRVR